MILGIDQGTTGSTCLVFDADGRPRGRAYSEFRQHFPRPGWVEHDAGEIWDVTRRVAREALDDAGIGGADLAGIGITNQRETAVAWDRRSGEPLHRAIVWQDRRTAGRCDELRAQGREGLFRERTGLVLDAYFSGTKYEWLLREGGVGERAALGTIDSWLVFKLCGRHVIGLLERRPHAAVRHPRAALGRGAVRAARRARRPAPRAGRQRGRLRRDDRVRRPRAGLRDGGRPAGGALRPGLPLAGARQEHVRDRQLPAPARRRRLAAARAGPDHDDRVGDRRPRRLRARVEHVRHRRRPCSGCATGSA